jgi:tartrate-resistant acid phosphatase type 5
MPLQFAAQTPSKPPSLPLSESVLARIPADYRAEAKAKISETEEIQQQRSFPTLNSSQPCFTF